MGSWCKCDVKQLKEFQKRLERLQKADMKAFCESASKELAARLLGKVINRTPVDSGVLKKGWTGGATQSAKTYANSLPVSINGDSYSITILNPIEYGVYVEYGHRTRNHTGWVEGRFMLTKSQIELESELPKLLERKLLKYFGEVFND